MPEYIKADLSLFGDAHVARYRETDGAEGYLWNGAPCLLLTTVGRRSGLPRTVALIFAPDGDRQILVASKGGAPTHPLWYENLVAEPRVEVQIRGERFPALARTVTDPDERAAAWAAATAVWPNYDDYVTRTDRVIPVVVLERTPA